MKAKKVTRFYCEYCGRGSQRSDSMGRHESVCYFNPARACLTCGAEDFAGRRPATDVRANVARLKTRAAGDPEKLLDLIECPTCVLAAVLQYNGRRHKPGREPEDAIWFDYKESLAAYRDTR